MTTLHYLMLFFTLFWCFLTIYFAYTIYAMLSGAPYVPTRQSRIKIMLEFANLSADDSVLDVGSGDGRVITAAAASGASCVGIEINPILFWRSLVRKKMEGRKNVVFERKDFWKTDLSKYDVMLVYCIHFKMEKLKEKIKSEMKPGSRVISHGFTFPDWKYIKVRDNVYLYIV